MPNYFKTFLWIVFIHIAIRIAFSEKEIDVLDYPVRQESNLYIDKELKPFLDTFLAEAKFYDLSLQKRVFALDTIQFAVLPDHIGGQTSMYIKNDTIYGKVEINNIYSTNITNIRFIFYHELGHWLGLEHSDDDLKSGIIMIPGYNFNDTAYTNLYNSHWPLLTYEYFDKLKSLKSL